MSTYIDVHNISKMNTEELKKLMKKELNQPENKKWSNTSEMVFRDVYTDFVKKHEPNCKNFTNEDYIENEEEKHGNFCVPMSTYAKNQDCKKWTLVNRVKGNKNGTLSVKKKWSCPKIADEWNVKDDQLVMDEIVENKTEDDLSAYKRFSPFYLVCLSTLPASKKAVWNSYLSYIQEQTNATHNLDIWGIIYLMDSNSVEDHLYGAYADDPNHDKDVDKDITPKEVSNYKKIILDLLQSLDIFTRTVKIPLTISWEKTYGYKKGLFTSEAIKEFAESFETLFTALNRSKPTVLLTKKRTRKNQALPKTYVKKTKPFVSAIPDKEQSELDGTHFLPEHLFDESTLPRSKLWRFYLDELKVETGLKINISKFGLLYLLNKDDVTTELGKGVLSNKVVADFITQDVSAASTWQETYGYQIHAITNDMIYNLTEFYEKQLEIAKRKEGKKSHKKQIYRKGTSRKGVGKGTGEGVGKGTSRKGVGKGMSRKGQVQTVNLSRKNWDPNYEKALEQFSKPAPRKAAPHPDETDDIPKRDYATKGKCLNDEYVEIVNPKNKEGQVLAAKACVRKDDEHCETWIRASNDRLVCAPKLEAKQEDKKETCEKFKPKIGDYEWRVETYTNSLGKRKTALNCFKKDCAAWQQSKNGNITCSK